jgi:hypothetical protein
MDIITHASRLGTNGSLKRLYLRKAEVVKVLENENEIPIYTDQIKRNYKQTSSFGSLYICCNINSRVRKAVMVFFHGDEKVYVFVYVLLKCL